MSDNSRFETKAIRQQYERSQHREHSVPLYMTSSFVFDSAEHARALFAEEQDGAIYSRYSNPNVDELVEKLKSMESADDGIACATGMAAVYASLAGLLNQGDHVVASRSLFGSTFQVLDQILPRFGITTTFVNINDLDAFTDAITEQTRMIVVESPSNPGLDIADLHALGELAKQHQLILNVDNCFATPYLQQPLTLGAHIVTHSATKFLDGQGRVLGGIVLGDLDLMEKIRFFARQTGPSMSPFNAWTISKSLETLAVRMDRHCENALGLAHELAENEAVAMVRYPHHKDHPQVELARKQMKAGGGLVAFELRGGIEAGRRFLDALKMVSLSPNLGDTRSIATHPASTTHSKLTEQERLAVGISPGLVRISVGLEHIDDIKADINQAIEFADK
ncbi:MAG: trans-sulfuration enzyme family protein [bacterium]